jgi:hypothetical protein
MKKNTVKGFVLFGMLVFALSANAQTKNKYTRLTAQEQETLAAELTKSNLEAKAKAVAKAKEMGWPILVKKEDGTIKELMKLTEDGEPLYYTTSNAGSAITSRANRVYPNGGAGLSLTGAGVTAGIWDGGQVRTTHSTFSSGRATQMDSGTDLEVHPTHVAGTIVGNGGSTPSARGIAYQGTLLAYDWANDTGEMRGVGDQIVASNHSYGLAADGSTPASIFGKYNNDARAVDQIAYDFPYYQVVVAAGNDRGSNVNSSKSGFDLLSQMGVSKNTLTVAAVRQVTNYAAIQPSEVELASFTNFGPTDDFRIKPNIATKGVNVYSSSSAGNNSYVTESGTSMASPGITGVIMLLQQHFSNLHPSGNADEPNYMLSASVRGLLSHTADEIGDENGPDVQTGWGLVNAEAAAAVLSADAEGATTVVFDERTLSQGGIYEIEVLADNSGKVSASISWTDPAGNTANNVNDSSVATLVNNLDLKVTKGSEEFFPWKVNRSFANPYIETGDNNVDNLEKVDVYDAAGTYKITVSHKDDLRGGSQDYTLIVTGVTEVASVKKLTPETLVVWPNPSNGSVNIQLADTAFASDAVITVFDVQGRQVLSRKATASVETINTSSFAAGMYLVKLNSGGKEQIKKFIVK